MVKKSKAKPANSLPNGWMVLTKFRKKGASKGKCDKTYYSPEMESFRSLRAAKRFLIAKAHALANEEEDQSDNVKNIVTDQASFAAANDANDANDNSNVVTVVDSSSSSDESDDDSMWM